MSLIRFEDVHFSYAREPVLSELNLSVPDGAVTVLVGPSGSGKSTVLRLIAGFEAPQRGVVLIGDEAMSRDGHILVPPEARGVSMVFQDLALWPHMTVRQTLEFVLGREAPPDDRRRRIDETLAVVGLERHGEHRPADLSGGERQRVALARAIVTRPRILLIDEPLSNLDPPLRGALMDEIRQLQQRLGLTILYVTHNQQETFGLGDHAAVLRGGRVEQWGTPRDLYDRPRTAFVASFLGKCALLPASIRGGRLESALGALPLAAARAPSEPEVCMVIRPEDVLVNDDGPLSGKVERAVCLGGAFEAEIAGPGWRLRTILGRNVRPAPSFASESARSPPSPLGMADSPVGGIAFKLDMEPLQVLSSRSLEVTSMNPLDRLLNDEMNRLLDRIATTVPGGSLAAATAAHPVLRARLDETEARLAALRATLLETYGDWGRTLEDLENLWALAAWRREEASLAA